jgi:hypothetical protein
MALMLFKLCRIEKKSWQSTRHQARISLRAGGAAAQGPARGGAGFEDLLYIFFAAVKNFACGAIF